MPFLAKCPACSFLVKANKRKMLDLLEAEHERNSHRGVSFDDWIESVINDAEYIGIVFASESPTFWKAYRGDKKPVFSGLCGRGE
jgi:hypothetical protein